MAGEITIKFQEQVDGIPTGEVISQWTLNPSQQRFWDSKKKVILFSGGFGCGKSLMLVLKAIDLALKYPKNFILMGRQTYVQLRDSLLKEFLVTCPPYLIKSYFKSEMKIEMINGAEIIFRHLDKIAENELRSLNLGAIFIDQAEDIDKKVFLMLLSRLRREGIADEDRKLYMSINPELTWHFEAFKQNPKPEYDLIEASTYENRANLPPGYIEQMEAVYEEDYRQQYLEGKWDESLLSKNAVFPREFIEGLASGIRKPKREKEKLMIYEDFKEGHRYQMGIDVAEGSEEDTNRKDKSSIVIVDLTTLEEVAHWSGQLPPDVVAEMAAQFARWYQKKGGNFCTVIPEMNAIGLALVNKLKLEDDIHIYRREEFDKSTGKKLKQLGWRTTRESKPLLISHFKNLLRRRRPEIRTAETLAEFRTFVYSNEARKSGMAAKTGFHDDRLMATLLAFFEKGQVTSATISQNTENSGNLNLDIKPTLLIKNGVAHFAGMVPRVEGKSWLSH